MTVSGDNTSIYNRPRLPIGRRPRPGETPPGGQSRRQRNRGRNQHYAVSHPSQFNMDRFAAVDNLRAAFDLLERDGGHGAGVDGLTFVDFSRSEKSRALRRVSQAILDGSYKPFETRLVLIPKDANRSRELRLQRLTDRAASKALQLALDPYWRSQLPGIGRNVLHIYADMQRVMRQQKKYVLAIDDVRDCFPSAPIDRVIDCHRQHITQPELLRLVERVIRGHDGLDHRIGLDQGSPYSPTSMELLLHTCLDARLEAGGWGYPLLLRYVDNLTFMCSSEREGHEILRVTGEILADVGMTLKGKDGEPQDIRDPNFNTSVLGLIPRWEDGQLKFTIPEPSFDNLSQGLINAMNHSRPTVAARWVTKGWLEAVGPALTNVATDGVIERVLSIGRRCGFRELSVRELRQTASEARSRWIRLCQSSSSSG